MVTRSHNHATLMAAVLDQSEAQRWRDAVLEWEIRGWDEDAGQALSCICGHPGLRYLFTIVNTVNGSSLFPIGSVCINQFGRDDLDEQVSTRVQMFRLLQAIEAREYISLDSEHFSRKLLRLLFEEGAFQPSEHNGFDPQRDYEFILKMFNKQLEPTPAQSRKIRAIMVMSIKPYLLSILRGRTAK
jgi:hypothetical protein